MEGEDPLQKLSEEEASPKKGRISCCWSQVCLRRNQLVGLHLNLSLCAMKAAFLGSKSLSFAAISLNLFVAFSAPNP